MKFNFDLAPDLRKRLEQQAKDDGRRIGPQINAMLKEALDRREQLVALRKATR